MPLIADASQPDVSPDGTRIAFVRSGEVWTAGIDGAGATPATTLGGAPPAFSPDGALIVYSRFEGGTSSSSRSHRAAGPRSTRPSAR